MLYGNLLIDGRVCGIETDSAGKIAAVLDGETRGVDCRGLRAVPGMVDVHSHGCAGMETMDADLAPMARFLASRGTTTWLPTTSTAPAETLRKVVDALDALNAAGGVPDGARMPGVHLEGPYINPKKKGAQNEAYIRPADPAEVGALGDTVKIITLAPEAPGAMEFIRQARCKVVLGHTVCDCALAREAFRAGANGLTHTFNAMPQMLHRDPGPIAAALVEGAYAQVISDGLHVAPEMVYAAYRMFGPDRMVLISDSIRSAGLPDGEFDSGGLTVYLRNGEARLADGTLAGSSVTLWECVRRATRFGIPFEHAVRMATKTAAASAGLEGIGELAPGSAADWLLVDEDLALRGVVLRGRMLDA